MAARLVLVLGDLFIPDRAIVSRTTIRDRNVTLTAEV